MCPGAGSTVPTAYTRRHPQQVGFVTKPALAQAMLTRALNAAVPAAWVTGDEVYGADPRLRAELEARGVGYVLAVACDPIRGHRGGPPSRHDARRRVPPGWQCVSAGRGAKGHRLYEWALEASLIWRGAAPAAGPPPSANRRARLLPLLDAPPRAAAPPWSGRRASLDDRGALPDRQGPCRPGPASGPVLALLVSVDHPCDARPRLPPSRPPPNARHPAPAGPIPLTRNESPPVPPPVIQPRTGTRHRLRWSDLAATHQHRAETCHYQRQARQP